MKKEKEEKEVNRWSIGKGGELPLGFGMGLTANGDAMDVFSAMNDEEKERVVEESRQQHSKKDMEAFVNRLGNRGF